MTNDELNRLQMFRTVRDFLTSAADKLKGLLIFASLLERLVTGIKNIDDAARQLDGGSKGKTDVKREAAKRMHDLLHGVRAALYAFAKGIGDRELMARSKTRFWMLFKMRNESAIHSAERICEDAMHFQDQLLAYGIGPDEITALQNSISAVQNATGNRDQSQIDTVITRKDLKAMFTTTDELLRDEMDNVLARFRSTDPTFYNGYRNARQVKALGTRRSKKVEAAPSDGQAKQAGDTPAAPGASHASSSEATQA
jgi:hypothetical protein